MEAFEEQHPRMATDQSIRMASRPQSQGLAPGGGRGMENLNGFGFASQSRETKKSDASSKSSRSHVTVNKRGSHATILSGGSEADDSDDEMDLLSSSSKTTPKRSQPRSKPKTPSSVVKIGDQHLKYHDNYKPRDMPLPKFKKIKKQPSDESSQESPKKARSSNKIPPERNPSKEPKDTGVALRDKSPSPNRSQAPPRPKPRPVGRMKSGSISQTLPSVAEAASTPSRDGARPRTQVSAFPMDQHSPVTSKIARKSQETREKGKGKQAESAFPNLSPLSSQSENMRSGQAFPGPTPLSTPSKGKSSKSKGSAYPQPSPLRTQSSSQESGTGGGSFPIPSPLISSGKTVRGSGCPLPSPLGTPVKGVASNGSDAKLRARLPAAPFPSFDSPPSAGPPKGSKRASDHDHSSGGREKRRKGGLDDAKMDLDVGDFENANDSLIMDPSTDPKTLCPYCDEKLPDSPTAHLKSLLVTTRKRSHRDARPTNPLGLKAPLTAFIAVCQRHRFEAVQVPLARARGWPTYIEWGDVRKRVEGMREDLLALITDPSRVDDVEDELEAEQVIVEDDSSSDHDNGRNNLSKGPRAKSVFWVEIARQVKKKGSRAAVGVQGQFASFEKTQPGYYGEQGSLIIHQTLYNLFPPSSLDPNLVLPLTPTEFIQRVLFPEAALALIREDMGVSSKRALKTMRESVQYGVAMFPDTGAAGHLGEEIVKERARARRAELEDELREDEATARREEAERQGGSKTKARKPRKKAPTGGVADEASHVAAGEPKPGPVKPRPRPVKVQASTASAVPEPKPEPPPDAPESDAESDVDRSHHNISRTRALKHRPKPKPLPVPTRASSGEDSSDSDLPAAPFLIRRKAASKDGGLTDASEKKPRSKAGVKAAPSESKLVKGKGKAKAPPSRHSSTDTDIEVVDKPAPSSSVAAAMADPPTEDASDVDTEDTPRALKVGLGKARGLPSSQTSGAGSFVQQNLVRTPVLERARRRRAALNAASGSETGGGEWSRSMRSPVPAPDDDGDDDDDDDDREMSDVRRAAPQSTTDGFYRRTARGRREDAWLLSDDSHGEDEVPDEIAL